MVRVWSLGLACLALASGACATGGAMGRDGGRPLPADAGAALDGALDAARASDLGSDGGPRADAFVPVSDSGPLAVDALQLDVGMTADLGTAVDLGAVDLGAPELGAPDAGPRDAGTRDAGPLPMPGPGSYLYTRVALGGLTELVAVAFHPDGRYALLLDRTNTVRVLDWATGTATRIDRVPTGGRTLYLEDVVFEPGGAAAWIVGSERTASADEGVILRFDDAMWRAGVTDGGLRKLADTRPGERFTGLAFPIAGGPAGDSPIVLSQSGPSPGYIARLRSLDTAAGAFGAFVSARPTSAGCDGLAFAQNELGGWGIAVVCGTNGGDAPFYTEIGGVPEWRAGPPATLGNTSRIASYPSGAYALAVGWSGRRVHRFEAGAWRPASSAPGFATEAIWNLAFAQDGRRALVVGGAGGTPLAATVLEYRHDAWTAAEITDVSIASFSAAPWLGDTSTRLNDVAWRPGCEGGLIVGGRTNVSGSTGLVAEFRLEGGRACR